MKGSYFYDQWKNHTAKYIIKTTFPVVIMCRGEFYCSPNGWGKSLLEEQQVISWKGVIYKGNLYRV